MEAFVGIQENFALVDRPANGCAIVHSDSEEGIQRLNQEAAKVMAHAQQAGMEEITPEHALRWPTDNPATAQGIADPTRKIGRPSSRDRVSKEVQSSVADG